MSWRRACWIGLILAGIGQAQEVALLEPQGFVKNLEGGWSGRKVINTQYPGSVSLVRGDSSGNVVVAGQLYTSSQGGSGLVPFLVRYATNGALQWSKQIQADDLSLDAKGNLYVTTTLTENQAIEAACGDFPRAYALSKYGPQGQILWKLELCSDSDFGRAYLEATPEGRLLVSAPGVLAPFCLGVSDQSSLLSLDSDGMMEWCAATQTASSPKVDAAGDAFVLDGETVRGFDPKGQVLWKDLASGFYGSPRAVEGFDATGNLILSDLSERVLLVSKTTGQFMQNFTPLYLECLGKRLAAGNKLYSSSVLQGSDGTPYYYLSECDLSGQVLNIRRWLETDLRIVDTFDNNLPGILIGGSTSLPNQSEQFPFVQKLGSDLKD